MTYAFLTVTNVKISTPRDFESLVCDFNRRDYLSRLQ